MKVILKNGIKIRVSRSEAKLLSELIMDGQDVSGSHIRIKNDKTFALLFKADDISAIV